MNPVVRFVLSQLLSIVVAVVMAVVLIPFCLCRAWRNVPSRFEPNAIIDEWAFGPLNLVSGNPEDGVSGRYAKVWTSTGERVAYEPDMDDRLRAWLWSAIRNSVNSLKYRLAWKDGPLWTYSKTIAKWVVSGKAGWQEENGVKVLVFSPIGITRK